MVNNDYNNADNHNAGVGFGVGAGAHHEYNQ